MIMEVPWVRNKNLKQFPTHRMIELLDQYKAKVHDHKKEMEADKYAIMHYFNEIQARAGTKDKEANNYLTKRGWELD